MSIHWQIPPSVLDHLERIESDKPVALLLRHSVRDHLPPGDAGYTLPITEDGRRIALEFGRILGKRLKTLHTSPLLRCVQTAEALRDGAGSALTVQEDKFLGDPGVYVLDGRRAWAHWQTRGHAGVMAHLVACADALDGMARPDEAARFLVHHMLSISGRTPGVHVFITHDSLVTATAARLLRQPFEQDAWPWYLEGAFFWMQAQGLSIAYRAHERHCVAIPVCGLENNDVIEFARREIAATIGFDSGARFFLAGGAFKTLLNGRPPHDLDLWASSAIDRDLLIQALERQGARRLDPRPFADAYMINGRTVEIPHKTEPSTLEERLAHFDLALSAVGVESTAEGAWRALIHPLAKASVERQQVLLLKPLVNWKHALSTLERARRYAEELGFTVPPGEEEEIWRIFLNQAPDMRSSMLERYLRTGRGTHGVMEEVLCRSQ